MAIARKTTGGRSSAATGRKARSKSGSGGRSRSRKDDDGPARSTAMGLEVDDEVLEFIRALDRFKKANNRPFPSWSEVLFVLKELGYRKG